MKRLLLCAALLALSSTASAVVYKWIDTQGKIQYGDRPPDGVHAEIVEMLGAHVQRSTPAAPSAVSAPNPVAAAPRNPSPREDPQAKAVAEDVAQARAKQCTDAQDRYKKLIEGRKLYKAGADGERQYLTSDEIDAERLSAKRDLDATCNSPT